MRHEIYEGGVLVHVEELPDPVPTVAAVKQAAQERIYAFLGVTTFDACVLKQLNAQMRATELVNKKAAGQTLTVEETAEAIGLQAIADQIKAIRAKSNEIEAMSPIPADYATNDTYWS